MRGYNEWFTEGLCTLESYNSDFIENSRNAKSICYNCPVANDCLIHALIYREHGIWGGTTEKERDAMIKASPGFRAALISEAEAHHLMLHYYTIADDFQIEKRESESFAKHNYLWAYYGELSPKARTEPPEEYYTQQES